MLLQAVVTVKKSGTHCHRSKLVCLNPSWSVPDLLAGRHGQC